MNQHKQLAIKALQNMRGDDLYKARVAFYKFTTQQMQEQHGESGMTRAQIIEQYEITNKNIESAIQWVNDCAS